MPGTRYLKLVKTTICLILTFFGKPVFFASCFRLAATMALVAGFLSAINHPRTAHTDGPFPFSENFNEFAGTGFSPDPTSGQLDSDVWIVTGLSDGDLTFGDIQTSGDFSRGKSNGGVGTGGIYAFDRGAEDNILGLQAGGSDFTPGEIILRLQNGTGTTITHLNIDYDIWYYNDQNRANSLNFSYSTDQSSPNYTTISDLDFTTPITADATPLWQSGTRSITLTDLDLLDGDFIYLKWRGDDDSGSGSRDEYGIDNVQVSIPNGDTPTPTPTPTVTATPTATVESGWIINEIHADPDETDGDANDDGIVSDSQDEFVEIINNTGSLADISGWTLSDGNGLRHTFPPGMIVPDQCAFVVFGGGAPVGTFGGALIQTAGSLGLNNSGDTVILSDGSTDQAAYRYSSEAGNNQSLTRDPDVTGADPLVWHSTAAGSGGALFSPGTKVDGSTFGKCDIPPTVISTEPGPGAPEVTVNTTVNIHFNEIVSVEADPFSLECPTGTVIPVTSSPALPGQADSFTLTPNLALPYNQTCTLTVTAAKVVDQDGSPDSMVADYLFNFDTAPPPPPLLISEFLYDGLTPSSEGDEFVQICNTVHHLCFR